MDSAVHTSLEKKRIQLNVRFRYLAEPFATMEPQSQVMDEFSVAQKRRSADFEAVNS